MNDDDAPSEHFVCRDCAARVWRLVRIEPGDRCAVCQFLHDHPFPADQEVEIRRMLHCERTPP